jgi:hypothetical protein
VGFLRRLLGGGGDQPSAAWYEIPRGGYFAVAGVVHHTAEIARVYPLRRAGQEPVSQDIFATLQRQPQNPHDPNAVAVLLDGHLAGYIPKENASAWSHYLARLEADGYRVKVHARIWIGNDNYYLNLRADEDADYALPSEQASRAG